MMAAVVIITAGLSQASLAANLLLNPGFESGNIDWATTSTLLTKSQYNWTYMGYAYNITSNFRPENKTTNANKEYHSGTNASRTNTSQLPGHTTIYQDVYVAQNSTYNASVWVRARDLSSDGTGFGSQPGDSVGIWIQELDIDGNLVVDHGKVGVTKANTAYEQINYPSFTTASNTAKVRFMLDSTLGEVYGKTQITYDDCVLDGPSPTCVITGTVTDGTTPLSNVAVTVTGGNTQSALTGSNGVYAIAGVQADASGKVTVRVAPTGYYAQTKTRSPSPAPATNTCDFTLIPVGNNLLQNAGFDDGWPAGNWNTYNARATVGHEAGTTFSPTSYISGEDAACIYSSYAGGTADGDGRLWQTVSVLPNQPYTASVQFTPVGNNWTVDPAEVAGLFVKEYDAAGNLIVDHPVVNPTMLQPGFFETLTDAFTSNSKTAVIQIGGFAHINEPTPSRAIFEDFALIGPAGPAIPMLSGVVTGGGAALSGAAVTTSGAAANSTYTTSNGHYSFNVATSTSSYTIRASQAGYYAQQKSRVLNGTDIVPFDLVPIGQNLLVNPGFDDGFVSDWTRTAINSGVVGGETSLKGDYLPVCQTGEQAAVIYVRPGNGGGDMYQVVPVQPGQAYTATVWCKASWRTVKGTSWGTDPNQKATLYATEYDALGNVVANHTLDAVVDPNAPQVYQKLSIPFTTAVGTIAVKVGATAYLVDAYDTRGLARVEFDSFEFNGPAFPASPTVSSIKSKDGSLVSLTGKIVTGRFGTSPNQFFYIEDPDRSAGIRVTVPPGMGAPNAGEIVNVYGLVQTVGGEKQITAASMVHVTTGGTVPGALGMSNRTTSTTLPVGLRVSVWGTVGDIVDGYFYLDDGSGTNLKVYTPSSYTPVTGDYVTVVGILGSELAGTDTIPVIRATAATKQN